MKATQELVMAFTRAVWTDVHGYVELDRDEIEKGVQAVLDLIMPDQEHAQRVYVDGDTVTVIDRRERTEEGR